MRKNRFLLLPIAAIAIALLSYGLGALPGALEGAAEPPVEQIVTPTADSDRKSVV